MCVEYNYCWQSIALSSCILLPLLFEVCTGAAPVDPLKVQSSNSNKKQCQVHVNSLIEYFVQFWRVVRRAKAKHVFWFPAAIGTMQFSRQAWKVSSTISRDFSDFLSYNVGLRTKVFQALIPIEPRQTCMLRALTCLIPVNPPWTFHIPKNGM